MTEQQRDRIIGALRNPNHAGGHAFSAGQGTLPGTAPKLPSADERQAWGLRTREYAAGARSHAVFKSDREKAVKDCSRSMDGALNEANPDQQVLRLAASLKQQLQGRSFAGQPQIIAEQQRADMVLESLLSREIRNGGQRLESTQVMTAVASLSPDLQRQLLQADRATGNRLYNKMDLATRDDPMSRQVFEQVRPQANAAAALARLDQRDPTGLESQLTKDFLRHLEERGVSPQAMAAVSDKLAFRTQMMGEHKEGADMPKLDPADAHCRDKFTARLFSTLAELPKVSDEDLSRALVMPQDKLLMVTGTSLGAMREGDVRLLKAVKDAAVAGSAQTPELGQLAEVIEKTQARQWNRAEAANPAHLTSISDLRNHLQADANGTHQRISQGLATRFTAVGAKMTTHAAHIQNTVLPALQNQIDAARADLASGAAVGPEAEGALQKLENKHQRLGGFATQLQQTAGRIQTMNPTEARLRPLVERFGALEVQGDPFTGSGTTPGTGDADNIKPLPFRAFMEFTKQVDGHLAGMDNKERYAAGLANVAPVLPTAGRDLNQCPWLSSTVEDMARSARFVQNGPGAVPGFSLERAPIVIIDQSDVRDEGLWNRNHELCERLMAENADTGLKIVHLKMTDVERLAGADANKLFDASQSRNAGYGGARNMAYMIAPLIRHCENTEGLDWKTMDAQAARGLIQSQALERNGTTLFMGDDTDLVTPGTMLAKAVVANVYCGQGSEYTLVSQKRDGRDTMGVNETQTNHDAVNALTSRGYDAFAGSVFSSNKWNSAYKAAGMGCTAGDARFCLDLPLGAEEKQHEAARSAIDNFSGSSHLSGDRQGELSSYLQGHLNYTHSSSMVKALIMDSKACAWNSETSALDLSTGEARFDNLGEVMEWASQPDNVKKSQQAFLSAMCDWQSGPPAGILALEKTPAEFAAALPQNSPQRAFLEQSTDLTANAANVRFFMQGNPQLAQEELEQLRKVADTYNHAGRQATECRQYMNTLMDKLVPGPPAGSQLALDDRKTAVREAVANAPLTGDGSIAQMIEQTREEMSNAGVAFTADNRLMRDLHLATESVAGGGFARLAQNIRGPAQNIAVEINVAEQQPEIALNAPQVAVNNPQLPANDLQVPAQQPEIVQAPAENEVSNAPKQPKAKIAPKAPDAGGLPVNPQAFNESENIIIEPEEQDFTSMSPADVDKAIVKHLKPDDIEVDDVTDYHGVASEIHKNVQPDAALRNKPDTAAIEVRLIEAKEIEPLNEKIALAEHQLAEREAAPGVQPGDPQVEALKSELNEMYEDLDNWEARVETLKASMKVDDRKNRLTAINTAAADDRAALPENTVGNVRFTAETKLDDGNPRQEHELQISAANAAKNFINKVPTNGIDPDTLQSRIGQAYNGAYTYEGPDRLKEDGSKQRVKGANDRGISPQEKERLAAEMQPVIDQVNELQETVAALENTQAELLADMRAELEADPARIEDLQTRQEHHQAQERVDAAAAQVAHCDASLQKLQNPGRLEKAAAILKHGSVDNAREHYETGKQAAQKQLSTANADLNRNLDKAALAILDQSLEGKALKAQIGEIQGQQNKLLQNFHDVKQAQAASIKPDRVQQDPAMLKADELGAEGHQDVKSALKAGKDHLSNPATLANEQRRHERIDRLKPSVQDVLKAGEAGHQAGEDHGPTAGNGSLRASWKAANKPTLTRSASAPHLGKN